MPAPAGVEGEPTEEPVAPLPFSNLLSSYMQATEPQDPDEEDAAPLVVVKQSAGRANRIHSMALNISYPRGSASSAVLKMQDRSASS